MNINTGCGLCY